LVLEIAALDKMTETPVPYPAWMQPLAEDGTANEALSA
jgi:hypothetical protein